MDTLWNIIRDFFVRYVFGGVDSLGSVYDNTLGYLFLNTQGGVNDDAFIGTTNELYYPIGGFSGVDNEGLPYNACLSFPDWLSTTATIITLIALFIGITMLTIKLFKFVSNVLSMR